ncbi:MAG: succinyl-diaminopimelate desuccinylase [Pseudomonadota bacterium]
MHPTLALTRDLIERQSVTPADCGCQRLIAQRLADAGFTIEHLPFGDVTNLWARRGDAAPLVCFAGHTDVVPTGPLTAWQTDPFTPTERDGILYGRGAADMKGNLAAMVCAVEGFVAERASHSGSIAFLLTSNEEGPAVDGTRRVVDTLQARGEHIDYCIVGEPSSDSLLGDTVRIGRRGSLNGYLTVHGIQGHVAYSHKADNPIHRFAPALAELVATEWDTGDKHFPPTSFQVASINTGDGAINVIPGELTLSFNLRFSPASTAENIQQRIVGILERHGVRHSLRWHLSGQPFFTAPGVLTDAISDAIESVAGLRPELSTGGGTSDGRFIAPTGTAVVELGVINASIHKIDEHVTIDDLERLQRIYRGALERLLP